MRPEVATQDFRRDVADAALQGLRARPKTLPSKLFYDAEGVRLFNAITDLPEYYLTRTETALLAEHAAEIAGRVADGATLVEYGASDEVKALHLLDAVPGRFARYVPIDVAPASLAGIAARLADRQPPIEVRPIEADFTRITRLQEIAGGPVLGFFPGSTIGNFEPDMATALLETMRETLGDGSLLVVGTDLRKSPDVLLPAYDDAAGITAAFNLNLLRRLNREADADFADGRFEHRAVWNDAESRIEMHLVSLVDQRVRVAGQAISFAAGETIHSENSYKHSPEAFAALADRAGWRVASLSRDPRSLFGLWVLAA